MPQRIAKRLLIVGWDAADWNIIDPLFARNGMPNLRKLVDSGVRANLSSLEPRLSPLLWTSVATGKTADKHGILNFIEPDPIGAGVRIAASTSRKTKAIWNILTQSGMRTNVVGWYATFPAEPINGVCVSNYIQEGFTPDPEAPWPINPATVHPPQMREEMAAVRMHPADLNAFALLPLVPGLREEHLSDPRVQKLARNMAHCATVHNCVTTLLEKDHDWDCTMVFYETIDTVGHNFMQYHPPKMAHVSERDHHFFGEVMYGIYQFHDMMLGRLLELAGPETTVILLSDHGFYSDARRPAIEPDRISVAERLVLETRWHRPLGVLAMSGPGIRKGERVFGPSLLDIAPTSLTLLGLPVGADMGGRVLIEALQPYTSPIAVETVFSWDMVAGDAGMHPPDLRQDPYEAHEALKQLVDLGYMAELPKDAKEQAEIARREMQSNLGTVLTVTGQLPQAIQALSELRQQYPDEARFALSLARAQLTAGLLDDCLRTVREFLSAHPRHIQARLLLATILARKQHRDEAVRLIAELEREIGEGHEHSNTFAGIYSSLGMWDDAKRHYHRLLEIDPDSPITHHELATIAVQNHDYELGAEHALRAVEIVHLFPEAHYTLGIALVGLKQNQHALQSFLVAVSMSPRFLNAHRYLATLYREIGDSEGAIKHRRIAERLMEEEGTGKVSVDFLKREAPIGPQSWTQDLDKRRSG